MADNEYRILAFAGHKRAGKDTACNFLHAIAFVHSKITPVSYVDDNTGDLIVETAEGENNIVKLDSKDPEFLAYMHQYVWPFIRAYAFADELKEFCVNMLGLTHEEVYGEDKDNLTRYLWEDMPVPAPRNKQTGERQFGKVSLYFDKKGQMTAREIMQYWGTEVFRGVYDNIHAENCLKKVVALKSALSVIKDCRFPNEVEEVQKNGGRVIYLTRNPEEDCHTSESALDPDRFDHSKFDAIIDNQNLTIEETCREIVKVLTEWGWIKHEEPPKGQTREDRKGIAKAR